MSFVEVNRFFYREILGAANRWQVSGWGSQDHMSDLVLLALSTDDFQLTPDRFAGGEVVGVTISTSSLKRGKVVGAHCSLGAVVASSGGS